MNQRPDSYRWVPSFDHVSVAEDGALPQGFRAAGVAGGIKPTGDKDVAIIVSDAPETVSAARFTASSVIAAPVQVTQERTRLDGLRAVVANSGNANAATGGRGLDEAARMQGAASMVAGVPTDAVAVASTGVIGVQLDGNKVVQALVGAREELRTDGAGDFTAAISTTDAFPKTICWDVQLSGGTVRLTGQAKGAGMIQPGFATMLCFVQTDAALSPETADLLFGVCVKRSFERISVDGQLSTNDTAILMASGSSGVTVEPQSEDEVRFGEALDAALRTLALDMVADGEGAKRIGRVVVRGDDHDDVETVARAVANSPLVKTALFGQDPNWGRIAQTVGGALPGRAPLALSIAIEGVTVCKKGNAIPFDLDALTEAVGGDQVEYVVELPGEGTETEVFFSDFGYEYVRINAEYTT
ncbi:MAG: bifunctional glutamate N-acetyltransferase/amino-acid acetyltransferase ArgJ [Solirubrobacteraceae bacterium]|nr:bifunctional glutamate N-acetyltransferase/amino-acid acetyltransferase ArgJ [Solirubrobacteraceae bacterium]